MVLTNRRSIYISIQRLHYFDCVSIHFTLWYQQRPKILYTIGMYHSVFTLIVQWKRRRFTAIHSFGNPLRPTKYLVHTLIRKTNEINTSRREYHHPFGLYMGRPTQSDRASGLVAIASSGTSPTCSMLNDDPRRADQIHAVVVYACACVGDRWKGDREVGARLLGTVLYGNIYIFGK